MCGVNALKRQENVGRLCRGRVVAIEKQDNPAAGKSAATSNKPTESFGKSASGLVRAADYGLKLSNGDYEGVAKKAAAEVAINALKSDKAGEVVKKSFEGAARYVPKAATWGQKIPLGLGAAITAGMVLYKVGEEARSGNFGKAGAELVAGTAQAVGNLVGFGAGDAVRETVRGVTAYVVEDSHPEWVPDKSGLRSLGEELLEKFRKAVAFTPSVKGPAATGVRMAFTPLPMPQPDVT